MTHEGSPFANPGAVAGRAPQPPATRSTFDRVFNPTKGGFLGLIGDLGGAQSRTSFASEQALGARSSGLSALAHQLAADDGLNTQRLILDHLASSAGMQGIQNDPEYLSKVRALAEGSMLTPSGRARRDLAGALPDTSVQDLAATEVATEKQRVDLLAAAGERAKLEPEIRATIQRAEQAGEDPKAVFKLGIDLKRAKLQLDLFKVTQKGQTQRERTYAELVTRGEVTELQALFGLVDAFELVEIPNEVGAPSGRFEIVNKLTLERTPTNLTTEGADTFKAGLGPRVGVTPPEAKEQVPDAQDEIVPEPGFPPAGIIGAGGAESLIVLTYLRIANQFGTATAGEAFRQTNADALALIGTSFSRFTAEGGRRFAIDAKALDKITKNLKLVKGPNAVGGSLIAMHDFIDNRANAVDRLLDPEGKHFARLTQATKNRLSDALASIEFMRAQLPSRADLKAEMLRLQTLEKSGAERAGELFDAERRNLEDTALGASPDTEGDLPGPPTLETPEDAPAPALSPAEGTIERRPGEDLPPAPAIGTSPEATPEKPFATAAGEALTDLLDINLADTLLSTIPPQLREAVADFRAVVGLRAVTGQTEGLTADFIQLVPDGPKVLVSKVLSQIENFGVGFNLGLAEFIGIPAEALHEAMVLLGSEGFLDTPGDSVQALKNAFEAVGFVPEPGAEGLDSFAALLGRDTFNMTVSSAVFLAGAPALAAQKAVPIAAYLGQVARDFATKYPWMFALTEVGAAVGERILVAAFGGEENMSPELRAILGVAGPVVGGVLFGAAKAGPEAILGSAKKAFMRRPMPGKEGAVDLTALADIATKRTELARTFTDIQIRNAVERFAPDALSGGANAQRAIVRLGIELRKTLKIARTNETEAWSASDQTLDMTPRVKSIVQWMDDRLAATDLLTRPGEIPLSAVAKVRGLIKKAPKGTITQRIKGLIKKAPPDTITRKIKISTLIKLRGEWLEKMRNPKTTARHFRFYKDASAMILEEISTQYSGRLDVAEALATSKWLNDRFFGGALKGFMLQNPGGDFNAEQALVKLIENTRIQGGEPSASVLAEMAIKFNRPQLEEEARNVIKTKLGQIAADLEQAWSQRFQSDLLPGEAALKQSSALRKVGQEFLDSPLVKAFEAAFPSVKLDVDLLAAQLKTGFRDQVAIEKSAFAAFSNVDINVAMDKMMLSPNRVAMVREMANLMDRKSPAFNALRVGLVDWLHKGTLPGELKPSHILARLNQQGIRQTFRQVYSADEMRRLDRMVVSAQMVEMGQTPPTTRLLDATFGKLARFGGALIGRFLNTGTIQVPGYMAQISADLMSVLLGVGSPSRMLARAMIDPKFERVLLAKIPGNLADVKTQIRWMRLATISLANATRLPSDPDLPPAEALAP